MLDFSLDSLRYFHAVARCGSFSAASLELYVSQSAISQSVRRLEESLCCPLFVRSKKQLMLTPDGKILFEAVNNGILKIDSGLKAVISRQNPEIGELKIASTDTLCKYHLLPVIKKMHKKYPEIRFSITNGTSPRCKQLLEQGEVDACVVNLAGGDDERYAVRKAHFFSDVFVASNNFKELNGSAVPLATLAEHPLIILDSETVTRTFFDKLFETNGIKVHPSVELQSVDLLLEMARGGFGIAFVPDMCVKGDNELFVIETKENTKQRSFGAITLKNAVENPLVNSFISAF